MKYIIVFFLTLFAVPLLAQDEVQIAMQWVDEYSKPGELDFSDAIAFYKSGDFKNAQKILDEYKKTYPNHEDILLFEGKMLMDKKKYSRAMEKYDKVLLINPKNAQAFYYRGLTKDLQGDPVNAIVEFTQAITLDPEYALPYEGRATSKSTAGDNFGAIEDYNKAIELNPKAYFAYEGRGIAYHKTGQHKKAIDDFIVVLKNNRERKAAIYYMGLSKVKSGDKSGCKDLYNAYQLGMQGASVDIKKYCE